ncbi:MAG: hypothetical protein QOG42_1517, partial [Solirubrobacteraceae bacterium]|nr:hypothetical protein [Solirubrobacteraceae bacterium]
MSVAEEPTGAGTPGGGRRAATKAANR